MAANKKPRSTSKGKTPKDEVAFKAVVSTTPEVLWGVIATTAGLSSWRGRFRLEERKGGLLSAEQPPELDPSDPFEFVPCGKVTRWNPPFELALEFFDEDDKPERWVIEPRGDAESVLELHSSSNPHDFLDGYLQHFCGEPGDSFLTLRNGMGTVAQCWAELSAALGLDGVKVGQTVRNANGAPTFSGVIVAVKKHSVWLRLEKPGPALLHVTCVKLYGPAPVAHMFVYGADQVRKRESIQAKWERFFDSLFP